MLDQFVPRLKAIVERARGVGRMRRSADTEELWEREYPRLKRAGDRTPACDRARPNTMRVAMLYALVDGSETIEVEHLRAALAVWDYCEESARKCFGGGEGSTAHPTTHNQEPFHVQLLTAIQRQPGILRSELLRLSRSVDANALGDALTWLHGQGLAFPRVESGRGRPAERWYPGLPPDRDISDGKEGSKSAEGQAHPEQSPKQPIGLDAGDTSFLPSRSKVEITEREGVSLAEGESVKALGRLGLVELMALVRGQGGRFAWMGERVGVVGCTPDATMTQALAEHQDWLRANIAKAQVQSEVERGSL